MKIEKYTKEIKNGTILRDSDGYFKITDYDKQTNLYHYIECNKFGTVIDKEMIGVLMHNDLIGAEIIKEITL